MSGGALFDYTYHNFEGADGKWQDEELDELYHDLFCGGEFSTRGYGGLVTSLDLYVSDDIGEESYRKMVVAFKRKWFRRTPRNRLEFYQKKLQECADRLKREMGEA